MDRANEEVSFKSRVGHGLDAPQELVQADAEKDVTELYARKMPPSAGDAAAPAVDWRQMQRLSETLSELSAK